MSIIVNPGSTLTISGLTITSDSTVAAGGLLDGTGTIVGGFTLLNLGTIASDATGGLLSIATGTLTNQGPPGTQGTMFADNASLAIQSTVALTDLSNGTLTGGVWQSSGTGTLSILTGSVITDDATITLNGPASALLSGKGSTQTIDNSLTTIGTAGALNLLGGRNFSASDSLVVAGMVTLGGGTLAAPVSGLTIAATGDVAGFGTMDPGTPVTDDGTIEAEGGTLALPSSNSILGGGTLQVDAGASLALQALGSYAQSIVNNGVVDAVFTFITGSLAISGASYSGSGSFLINGGPDSGDRAILELPSGLSANVAFDPNFGELLLDDATTFGGTLVGFSNNDTIVLPGIANAHTATLTGNALDLTNASGTLVQALTLNSTSMNYQNAAFIVTENKANTQATVKVSGVQAPCYAAGTLIRTLTGEVPVERLAAGDIVHARFAGTAPVVWIGHRHVDCHRYPKPEQVWPVRISAHAFGPRMPGRDLVLSPDHAVFVDDVLIPIRQLINGKTIAQQPRDTVTYYHVELGEHDVLLAEGMPAESYLECGDRGVFDNASNVIALQPDFGARRWEVYGCAPMVVSGPKIDAVAKRLMARVEKRRHAAHRAA